MWAAELLAGALPHASPFPGSNRRRASLSDRGKYRNVAPAGPDAPSPDKTDKQKSEKPETDDKKGKHGLGISGPG